MRGFKSSVKTISLIAILALASCATVRDAHTPQVHHVVLCWLKDSGNADQRRRIIEVSRSFKSIPGVLEARAGTVLASEREIVDDSFDVAITLSFADTENLKAYLAHPLHQQATKDVLLPLVKKIVVYDFQE